MRPELFPCELPVPECVRRNQTIGVRRLSRLRIERSCRDQQGLQITHRGADQRPDIGSTDGSGTAERKLALLKQSIVANMANYWHYGKGQVRLATNLLVRHLFVQPRVVFFRAVRLTRGVCWRIVFRRGDIGANPIRAINTLKNRRIVASIAGCIDGTAAGGMFCAHAPAAVSENADRYRRNKRQLFIGPFCSTQWKNTSNDSGTGKTRLEIWLSRTERPARKPCRNGRRRTIEESSFRHVRRNSNGEAWRLWFQAFPSNSLL
jgi:hypothetical protein